MPNPVSPPTPVTSPPQRSPPLPPGETPPSAELAAELSRLDTALEIELVRVAQEELARLRELARYD